MNRLSLFLCVPLVIGFYSVGASCEEIRKDYHETFNVNENTILRLVHGDGNVEIRNWDRDVLDVTVHYEAEFKSLGSGNRDFSVDFIQKKDVIEIMEHERHTVNIGFNIFNVRQYSYIIKAPAYIELELDGEDGDIDIKGWKGSIECRLEDGDITMSAIEAQRTVLEVEDGDVEIDGHRGEIEISGQDGNVVIKRSVMPYCRINLEDGDLRMTDCSSPLDAEMEDGSVKISGLSSNYVYIQTGDASVETELLAADGTDVDIRTEDGDIILGLQKGISAEYSIDVNNGRITVDLPGARDVQEGRHWQSGRILDGKGNIRLRTGDGKVVLRESR